MSRYRRSPSFSAWLREQRENRCLTQQQFAEQFRIEERTFQRWESGDRPSAYHQQFLVDSFGSFPKEAHQEWSRKTIVPNANSNEFPVNAMEPETPLYAQIKPYVFMAPDYPQDFVAREEFIILKEALLSQKSPQLTALTTALRGTGGYGKTTLATAICHDLAIKQKFQDGVLFVILGNKPLNIIGKIEDLLVMMGHGRSGFTSREAATAKLREALKDRSYLLFIDDVWHASDLTPFLEGGPRCARLITTRNDSVLPKDTRRIQVDAMNRLEAMRLLQTRTGSEDDIENLEAAFWDLAARLGKWPLLLSLANGVLRRRCEWNESLQDALEYLRLALEKRGVVAFDERNDDAREKAVAKTIEVSFEQLAVNEVIRYSELAIFPPDATIPFSAIQRLWKTTGGFDDLDTEGLCQQLAELSLLSDYDLSAHSIGLHDVMCSYLQTKMRTQLSTLHQRFLETYNLSCWADLSDKELYLWEHLTEHLLGAEQKEGLITTMKDIRYLATKVVVKGVSYVEQDLAKVVTQAPSDVLLKLLKQKVEQMGHLLLLGKTPIEVGGAIVSSLCGMTEAEEICMTWEQGILHPLLLAWHPVPESRDSALQRTFMNRAGVSGCAISPDRKWIASASTTHILKIWDLNTGKVCHTLIGHKENTRVNTCAFSPDGRWLISAGTDGTLKIWNAITGEIRHTLTGHTHWVNGCAISPDGTWLVSASRDRMLKIWDISTGELLRTLIGHTRSVNGCAISLDGKKLVSAGSDGTLKKIWDTSTGELLRTLTGHTGSVNGCAISPDGTWLVSAGSDRTLKIWDISTGELLHTLTGHTGSVNGCAISPDGTWLVSASKDHSLKIWNTSTGEVRHTLMGHAGLVNSCAISPDGTWVVSASQDKTLKIWNTSTEEVRQASMSHIGPVNSCAISPDGTWLVSAGSDRTLKIWDTSTGEILHTLASHTGSVNSCAISPDGTWLVSASDDGTLKIWDTSTRELLHTLTGHTGSVNGCTISPDGTWLVSAGSDRTLKIWDISTREVLHALTGHTGPVNGCAISLDGKRLVSASDDGTLKIWDTSTREVLRTLACHTRGQALRLYNCAISPDGKWLVSASESILNTWDVSMGEVRRLFANHEGAVNGCAIGPDGGWLISACTDHTLRIWDAQSARCIFTFYGDGAFHGCCIHPDGKHIIGVGKLGVYFLCLHKIEDHSIPLPTFTI